MNCRQCRHHDLEGYQMGVVDWPCARGVADGAELALEAVLKEITGEQDAEQR